MTTSLVVEGGEVAKGFALMLETACRDFEALTRMISGESRIISRSALDELQDRSAVQIALAKSFVFYIVRAGRICEHGSQSLQFDREERKTFLKAVRPVLLIRDVNEHGFDVKPSGRGKSSRPVIHVHEELHAALDETSMMINGPDQVLMGPVNLSTIYPHVAHMRDIAGFKSLYQRGLL